MNQIKPEKFKTDGRVICTSCGEFSGWTNEELTYVKGDKNLKCQNCKKVCVEVRCQNAHEKNVDQILEKIKYEQQFKNVIVTK